VRVVTGSMTRNARVVFFVAAIIVGFVVIRSFSSGSERISFESGRSEPLIEQLFQGSTHLVAVSPSEIEFNRTEDGLDWYTVELSSATIESVARNATSLGQSVEFARPEEYAEVGDVARGADTVILVLTFRDPDANWGYVLTITEGQLGSGDLADDRQTDALASAVNGSSVVAVAEYARAARMLATERSMSADEVRLLDDVRLALGRWAVGEALPTADARWWAVSPQVRAIDPIRVGDF